MTPPRETFTHRIWAILERAARLAVREEQSARTVEQIGVLVGVDTSTRKGRNRLRAALAYATGCGAAIRHRSAGCPVVWTVGTEPPFSRSSQRKVTLPIATVRAALAGDAAARAEIAAAIGGEA